MATFVAALVVFDGFLALLSAGDACVYPCVFQRFSKPICVIATISEQPFDLWKAAQQCPYSDVLADLSSGHEQIKRLPLSIADGMQLGVHVVFGSPDQALTPPFLTPVLVAVRWAFR